ncbi:cytochrome c biogenesis CcdA family protein [Agathobacter sp.]
MEYLLLFLEGLVTFISPCILPMIPVYISFFSGGGTGESEKKGSVAWNVAGFILGFTIVFTLIGALAGTFGALIKTHQIVVNIMCGAVIAVFGLNYMGVFKLRFLAKSYKIDYEIKTVRFVSSVLFGMIFSIGWTPCVGTFLGSALMIAVSSKEAAKGIIMLLIYSLGLGIPFMLCAFFIDSLKGAFSFLKKHYDLINKISGGILVVTGILMMTGMFYRIISIFTI